LKITEYPNGLTVKELKEAIKDWPETDEDGDPTEVWVMTEYCLSSIVISITPLNYADILLSKLI
jgi:hypothetical protein